VRGAREEHVDGNEQQENAASDGKGWNGDAENLE
jgi:hypothetical protein